MVQPTAYDQHRDRRQREEREKALVGRDIGPIPEIVNPERREACRLDLRRFCETYFAASFYLGWSDDQLEYIERLELITFAGGTLSIALPRGSGKTTLAEIATLLAILYGHRRFAVLLAAKERHALRIIENIKTHIETNDLLAEDFPEVCYPIARLERIAQRANAQVCEGRPTRIKWKGEEIHLPFIEGRPSSGGTIATSGITGAFRGLKRTLPDGTQIRPDMLLLDDPQTRESAASGDQTQARLELIQQDALGLAGPGNEIAAVAAVTVVKPDDLSDRLLDHDRHPEWRGIRRKMLLSEPVNIELWEEYEQVYREELLGKRKPGAANRFYRKHRAAMDEGAEVSWPARKLEKTEHNPGEVSGVQHAMNLRIRRGEEAFAAEYQNEPIRNTGTGIRVLTRDEIAAKVNGYERGLVPSDATHITAGIDVQGKALYWVVCAWAAEFTGYVLDYGAFPDQPTRHFTLANIKRTLAKAYDTDSVSGYIYAGLVDLCDRLVSSEWKVDGGGTLPLDLILVDEGWRAMTVRKFARESKHRAQVMPAKGFGIKASRAPINDKKRKPGERRGNEWQIPPLDRKKSPVRVVHGDVNYWKTQVYNGFAAPQGQPGSISLFGRRPDAHRMIAEHLTAEYREAVANESTGRRVEEWSLRPSKPDNHLFDATTLAAIAASVRGVTFAGTDAGEGLHTQRKTADFAAMQREAKERRRRRSTPDA